MKMRIAVGMAAETAVANEGLRTRYSGPALRIEGDDQVVQLAGEGGTQVFLAGRPIALRSGDGVLRAVKPTDALRVINADTCRDTWEGRFVMAVVHPDGSCDIVCDRYGQREVYYEIGSEGGVFATDLSLVPGALRPSGYDQAALAHAMMVYGFRPPKRHTFYKGVRRLGVDQQVRVRNGRAQVLTKPFRPAPAQPYAEHDVERYADAFIDAVRVRASAGDNVVSLSSGWDSTAVLSCLVKLLGPSKVKAAIVRMQYAHRSGMINNFEIERATAFAKHYDVDLRIVDCDYRDEGPEWFDRLQPLMRANQITSITAIGRAIWCDAVASVSDPGQVVFAGEISDGAHNLGFAQFATILDHPVLAFREYSDKMASFLFGPTFLKLMYQGRFQDELVYGLLRGRARGAQFDSPAGTPSALTLQLLSSFFLRANRLPLFSLRNSRVLTTNGVEMYSAEMEGMYLRDAAEAASPETLYAWYLHLYNSFHWQGSTVAGFPLMAEANGLIAALPFWDVRLQEFLSGMPEDWGRGLDLNSTKYPLKWTLKRKLNYPMEMQSGPHSYRYDVDASFSHSAEILYGSAFAPHLRDLLAKRAWANVMSPDVFAHDYLDDMVDRYVRGVEVRGGELTDLMALAMLTAVGWYGQ